ncbi:MAG: hypothetical protein R2769_09925 [Saprospiraceae bacterium]
MRLQRRPLKYGDHIRIETRFVNSEAAKLIFQYTIYNVSTKEVAATGETIRFFWMEMAKLQLTDPPFFEAWKKKRDII